MYHHCPLLFDETGLFLNPEFYNPEQWHSSGQQYPTSVNGEGVYNQQYTQNLYPSISWVCCCDLCLGSVQEFIATLNGGNGLGATISSSGPIYNTFLTSGANPSIQVVSITDPNGAEILPDPNPMAYYGNGGPALYGNDYSGNPSYPTFPDTNGGFGLLPTPPTNEFMGQQPVYPTYDFAYENDYNNNCDYNNNYDYNYSGGAYGQPYVPNSNYNKGNCDVCSSFADVAAQNERYYNVGNYQR